MKKEDIIKLPHKNLREKSKKVVADEETSQLISNMVDAALDWEDSRPHEISAALAAVQINQLQKAVIVRSDFEDKGAREFTALLNPEIVKYEGVVEYDFEGCLSVADVYGKVPRHSKIRLKALDINGNEIRLKVEGFLARVIQHEIDHTNGVLFIDHIKNDTESFYKLDESGELEPLDYEKHIKDNKDLWSD